MTSKARPGAALRGYRRLNNWTLADVSGKSGLPISTLSRIEKDLVSPTFHQLTLLSEGLKIDISRLLSGAKLTTETDGLRSINRIGDGETVETAQHFLTYLSSDLLKKPFTPIIGLIKARSLDAAGPLQKHPGAEFLFVLQGEVELHTEMYAKLRLKTGESIFFDSSMSHTYVAKESPCEILTICTSPVPAEDFSRIAVPARRGSGPMSRTKPRRGIVSAG